jgi:hypothetical protein
LGRSALVEVKLGHHFAELLGDQQRRGERNERSPFGCPGFCVARVPLKDKIELTRQGWSWSCSGVRLAKPFVCKLQSLSRLCETNA